MITVVCPTCHEPRDVPMARSLESPCAGCRMDAKARRRDRARTHRVSPLPGILRRVSGILDNIRRVYPHTLYGERQGAIVRDLGRLENAVASLCELVAEDLVCRPPGGRDDRREDAFVA